MKTNFIFYFILIGDYLKCSYSKSNQIIINWYIITIMILGYVWWITNHRPWYRCQWFITMATYWSHCDVTVMHMILVSLLSISFKTPQRSQVISILRWIFYNITWFIANSPLKRSWQWSKRIRHAFDRFALVILYFSALLALVWYITVNWPWLYCISANLFSYYGSPN